MHQDPGRFAAARLFSIGHSNHDPEPFFALLARHRIAALVDVRSIPSSQRFPHFKERALTAQCRRRGVSYRHCPELGNKVGGIARLLAQPEGQAELEKLAAAVRPAPEAATAYMCAETDWRDCHRQVIAQRLLEDFGITSLHIMRDGSLEPHPIAHVLPSHYGVLAAVRRPPASKSCSCCTADAAADDNGVTEDIAKLTLTEGTLAAPFGRWRSTEAAAAAAAAAAAPSSDGAPGCDDYTRHGQDVGAARLEPPPEPPHESPLRPRRWGRKAT